MIVPSQQPGTAHVKAEETGAAARRETPARPEARREAPKSPPPSEERFRDLLEGLDAEAAGRAMHAWMAEVFPLCRSLTGPGVRLTFRSLSSLIPLDITEVPTGTQVFDWTIPKEWEVREAWIKDPRGGTVADFRDNNLHLVGYSAPFRGRLSLSALRPYLHSLPDKPDWIPYRTAYWPQAGQPTWGFCLPHRRLEALPEGEYEVCVDTVLKDGSLTYAEAVVPGAGGPEGGEVLFSAHCCHPSLANDNLSGMAVAAYVARRLQEMSAAAPLRFTYRFLFAPVTLGALAWLSRNEARLPRIRHGMVLSLLGDSGPFTWKRSRRDDAPIDRAASLALSGIGLPFREEPFLPYGYDERQFCSPGFDLPMGCLMRTPFARYPEYHTSADDLAFVRPERLGESLRAVLSILDVLENDGSFVNLYPKGEPMLGRRGLFSARDGRPAPGLMDLLWVLNQADGTRSLSDTARRAGIPFAAAKRAAAALQDHGLIREKEGSS
jgi:aminopeptidase-like protein